LFQATSNQDTEGSSIGADQSWSVTPQKNNFVASDIKYKQNINQFSF